MSTRLSIIVAMAKDRVIGSNNSLPWHLPADLRHFKAVTMGHHIIMGRKTFESIGKPLPGRTSVVVTRNTQFGYPGILVAYSLQAAVALCGDDPEAFVIGGAELYRQAIPLTSRIYMTEIEASINGDTYFVELAASEWRETSRESHPPDKDNAYPFQFVILDRKP
jgi:dihydrofolate reductase